MIVVSNSSPLITLGKLGLLSLLSDLFGEVHLAEEVFQEVTAAWPTGPAAAAVRRAAWMKIHPCANAALLAQWREQYRLGPGELATILLARSVPAGLAIIDERAARQLAQSHGVKVMGCVGLLEIGHRKGLVSELRSTYERMLAQGTFIDREILNRSLASFQLPPL